MTNVNGRRLAYAVTPEGIAELAKRGKYFAIRTFKLANVYSEAFCKKFTEAKASGKTKVILYGDSYIKFIKNMLVVKLVWILKREKHRQRF